MAWSRSIDRRHYNARMRSTDSLGRELDVDQATSLLAVEANLPLEAVLDGQAPWVTGGAANFQEGAVTLASCSGDSGRTLAAGRRAPSTKEDTPFREDFPGRKAASGVGPSTGHGPLAARQPGRKTARAAAGTLTSRCPGHPAAATSVEHEAHAVERRAVAGRGEEHACGRPVKHIATRRTDAHPGRGTLRDR
jgi:hypothetical protein